MRSIIQFNLHLSFNTIPPVIQNSGQNAPVHALTELDDASCEAGYYIVYYGLCGGYEM